MRAHVYNSITLLYSRNYHNIVNQLYILSNLKKKKEKKKPGLQLLKYLYVVILFLEWKVLLIVGLNGLEGMASPSNISLDFHMLNI